MLAYVKSKQAYIHSHQRGESTSWSSASSAGSHRHWWGCSSHDGSWTPCWCCLQGEEDRWRENKKLWNQDLTVFNKDCSILTMNYHVNTWRVQLTLKENPITIWLVVNEVLAILLNVTICTFNNAAVTLQQTTEVVPRGGFDIGSNKTCTSDPPANTRCSLQFAVYSLQSAVYRSAVPVCIGSVVPVFEVCLIQALPCPLQVPVLS